jgi:hypothetical protein
MATQAMGLVLSMLRAPLYLIKWLQPQKPQQPKNNHHHTAATTATLQPPPRRRKSDARGADRKIALTPKRLKLASFKS